MRLNRTLRPGLTAVVVGAGVALAGCSGSGSLPTGPPPPDLTTPRGVLRALADYYSLRQSASALALLGSEYRFHPARPENIPFLASGQTSWGFEQEKEILELLLVPERTTWIDQVLLEIHPREQRDVGNGIVELDARVELKLLIGADSFVSAESEITYVLALGTDAHYHLVEEREFPSLQDGQLTVGELRAEALEDRTGG